MEHDHIPMVLLSLPNRRNAEISAERQSRSDVIGKTAEWLASKVSHPEGIAPFHKRT